MLDIIAQLTSSRVDARGLIKRGGLPLNGILVVAILALDGVDGRLQLLHRQRRLHLDTQISQGIGNSL